MYQYTPMMSNAYSINGIKIPGQSSTTLYVRNLPTNASETDILSVFQNFGNIREARFQKRKGTQEFLGTVFIEFVHSSAAKLAQLQLNERTWRERIVYIDFAKERNGQKEESTNETASPSNSLYVSNLPQECDKSTLTQIFVRFGTILDIRLLKTEMGIFKGVAFVDFALQESAAAAIDALDNTVHNNKTLKISYAANPNKRKGDDLNQGAAQETKRVRGDTSVFSTSYPAIPLYYDPSQMVYQTNDPSQWYGQGVMQYY